MTVLITGASGFVGLNLCEYLLARGDDVVAFSNAPMPEPALADFAQLPGGLEVAEGDVLDLDSVRKAFNRFAPRRVIHAAAMTPGEMGERTSFHQVMATNVLGTVNVLDTAWRHGVGRVLHLSSGAVYGKNGLLTGPSGELQEDHPTPLPETLYAISKYTGERIALRYRDIRNLDLVAVRLGAVFGPWEYDTGVRATLSAPLLSTCLALAGGEAVLSDEGRRDWLYARDVAEALAGLLDAPAPGHALYNLGSGRVWNMEDWCRKLRERIPGFSWRIAAEGEAHNVEMYGSTLRAPLSGKRLREETGFSARFGLEEAFTDYLDWLEAHEGYRLAREG